MSDKKNGAERRKHRRFNVVEGMIEPITLELDGPEATGQKQPAIMTDLSAGGVSLLMFVEPPHTKSFSMTISIPGLDSVPIEASVVRVHQKGETYSVALTFKKIPREAQRHIEK
ncbi:MAG: PilZ domain-containing protein, partial [Elusimicrobia bacterium]|nr:PilZ domain-containing protein [Elusimicrobiota bacterium]